MVKLGTAKDIEQASANETPKPVFREDINNMIGKIIINNVIAIAVHGLLSFMVLLLLISPIRLGHIGSILLSIACTIVCVLLYYLSGRFILRNTYDIWMNFASVAVLAFIVVVGMLLARSRPDLSVINLPFYPLMHLFPDIKLPMIFRLVVLCIFSLLPSLVMWKGLMAK